MIFFFSEDLIVLVLFRSVPGLVVSLHNCLRWFLVTRDETIIVFKVDLFFLILFFCRQLFLFFIFIYN